MRITERLRAEHEVILTALELLAEEVDRLAGEGPVDTVYLGLLLDFLQEYADRGHHAKEERFLFPALEAHGLAREGGPIGCMLHEHEQGRGLVRHLVGLLPALTGAPDKGRDFVHAAEACTDHLREHIQKENVVLFRMAAQILTPAEEEELAAAAAQYEDEAGTASQIAAWQIRIAALHAGGAQR
jgi:hemerythrin-like domain-containing protein